MGRPSWVPTKEQRDLVTTMVAYGTPEDIIARHLKVAPKTLRKHCRDEIELAASNFINKMVEGLVAIAQGRRGSPVRNRLGEVVRDAEGNVLYDIDWRSAMTAQMFIIARRGGDAWRESSSLKLNVDDADNSGARERLSSAIARLAASGRTKEPPVEDDAGAG